MCWAEVAKVQQLRYHPQLLPCLCAWLPAAQRAAHQPLAQAAATSDTKLSPIHQSADAQR